MPGCLAVAVPSAVGSFLVVSVYPLIEIGLKLFDGVVNLLAEGDLIELL